MARRLLSLPPGNQLLVATAVQRARLGANDTEQLVSLWHREPSEVRRQRLVRNPAEELARQRRAGRLRPQPRAGLKRLVAVLEGTALRMIALLSVSALPLQSVVLNEELRTVQRTLRTLLGLLGRVANNASSAAGDASSEID